MLSRPSLLKPLASARQQEGHRRDGQKAKALVDALSVDHSSKALVRGVVDADVCPLTKLRSAWNEARPYCRVLRRVNKYVMERRRSRPR
jgi:hypothetical protein